MQLELLNCFQCCVDPPSSFSPPMQRSKLEKKRKKGKKKVLWEITLPDNINSRGKNTSFWLWIPHFFWKFFFCRHIGCRCCPIPNWFPGAAFGPPPPPPRRQSAKRETSTCCCQGGFFSDEFVEQKSLDIYLVCIKDMGKTGFFFW